MNKKNRMNYTIVQEKESKLYTLLLNDTIILKECKNIGCFQNGFLKFKRKDGTDGWVKEDGTIFKEGLYYCGGFFEGYAVFGIEEGNYGWIKEDGTILKEGFNFCDDFKFGKAFFVKNNGDEGWIDKNGGEYVGVIY